MPYRFSSLRSLLVLAPIPRKWPRVWLKGHTLQKQKIILITIFLLVLHLLLDQILCVLLFFFIIYFYLIDSRYKYNKLLLI